MANIKRIDGKNGPSFKITVTKGRDMTGKQIRHYKTWTPDHPMTERQMEKEAQRAAFAFEREIELGYQADNRQTFAEYAKYVLELKERAGDKRRTLDRYEELLRRILPAIGHIKLVDLRPQHLNAFYKSLGEEGASYKGDKAHTCVDLPALLKERRLSRAKVAEAAGTSPTTITAACQGKRVELSSAQAIAQVLGQDVGRLFQVDKGDSTLSNKTILEHHRLIRTILAQAEREMLVPYNAAAKATPPKAAPKEVNYFQVDDIIRIRAALECEPLKWNVITHLLLITGCRRGEVMGLRWSRIDFGNHQIRIDTNLLYSPKRGIYEDTTKTSTVRFIKLPAETMSLLKQYRGWYLEQRLKNGDRWHDTDFLFVKDNGEPMSPDGITAWLRKFSMRHDLPHINPHAFRHTMASILISEGKDVVSVSKRLGHAKVSTTTDIYSHIIRQADEQASECLADVLLRPPQKKASR